MKNHTTFDAKIEIFEVNSKALNLLRMNTNKMMDIKKE